VDPVVVSYKTDILHDLLDITKSVTLLYRPTTNNEQTADYTDGDGMLMTTPSLNVYINNDETSAHYTDGDVMLMTSVRDDFDIKDKDNTHTSKTLNNVDSTYRTDETPVHGGDAYTVVVNVPYNQRTRTKRQNTNPPTPMTPLKKVTPRHRRRRTTTPMTSPPTTKPTLT
jgi:hypothetical protein